MTFKNLSFLLMSTFFISCGDNTSTSPIADVDAIKLSDSNISIYSTQNVLSLTSSAFYTDGTSSDVTQDTAWSSSDTDVFLATNGSILASTNGGDAKLNIDYASTFSDSATVHVKALKSINYSDINISDSSNAQTIYVTGNFENNETNVTMQTNILWSTDTNATISDSNASQITLTVDANVTSFVLTGTLFSGTTNAVDFNKTFN